MVFEICALFVCAFYLYNALLLPFGSLHETGPGFFPVVLGVLGVLLSAVLLVIAARQKLHPSLNEQPRKETTFDLRSNLDLAAFVGAIALFILVFESLGGIIALFLLVMVLAKISGMAGWMRPGLLGLLTTAALYIVFDFAFKISMPMGVLSMIL